MLSQMFLGEPPANIKTWIVNNYVPPTPPQTYWDTVVTKLESFSDSMIGTDLPAIGSELSTKYDIAADGNSIDMPWQVLGYNSSIPKYIKYKDQNGNKIYVSSVKAASNGNVQGHLLSAITTGDVVYTKNSSGEYESTGQTVGSVNGNFTYGQTNEAWGTTATESGSYSVPASITVSGITYSFVGYNMTLATRGTIGVVKNGIYYNRADFNSSTDYYTNDWSGSQIRAWLNGYNADFTTWYWYYDNDYTQTNVGNTLPKFTTRFNADNTFLDNVVQVVNRTWVWETNTWNTLWNKKVLDSNKCEHVVDKFWLLGFGHVNSANSQYRKDWLYDTAHYSTVFGSTASDNSRNERKRYQMNADGSMSAVARAWRLCSAYSTTSNESDSISVGYVKSNGSVNDDSADSTYNGALFPACTIG